jgi:1-acyl-sn-glycerol-3-phosphate acyltransferase
MIMYYFSLKLFIHLFLLRPFIKLIFGVNLFGNENIYNLKNFIIIANHNSHLDTLLLFYLLPVKQILITHPVAAKEYFSKSKIIFHFVTYLFSPIWVTRGDPSERVEFMNEVKNVLDKGHNIIMYPEGTRGLPGEIQSFKSGVGRISEQYRDTPIIPVFISGTEKSFPKSGFIPIPIWNNIIIRPPQVFKESYNEITHSLEDIIQEMSKNEAALRHNRKLRKTRSIKSIAVLGIDGSGKSTLSKNISILLSDTACAALVSDKLEFFQNNKLKPTQPFITENIRERVSKIAKNAKSLKMYKIPKLVELLLRDILLIEIKKWYHPDIIVLDGSPLLNLTAWAILYKEKFFNENVCLKAIKILSSRDEEIAENDQIYKDFPELSALKKLRLTHLNLPDIVIFLDVEPCIAIDRIDKRGQKKQVHETEEKLTKLRNAYLITCKVIQRELGIPTYVLAGNDTIKNITGSAVGFINKHR